MLHFSTSNLLFSPSLLFVISAGKCTVNSCIDYSIIKTMSQMKILRYLPEARSRCYKPKVDKASSVFELTLITVVRWNEIESRYPAQKCFDDKEGEFTMSSGQVGATSQEMQAAENNFKQRVQDFDAAAQNIRNAVSQLASSWKGNGYDAFMQAMGKWDSDMKTVGQSLESLSDAVRQADSGFQDLDAQIAKSFGIHQ
jgi:WXG100 family type VII secretion target